MPRQSKNTQQAVPQRTLIVDNGAYSIKAGFASKAPQLGDCHIIPNCIARDRGKKVWIGSQLHNCTDFGEVVFRRPVERGYLVNWEAEKAIWDNTFFDPGASLKCDPRDTNLILTESPNSPAALQTNCDQMVFEEFDFASCSRHVGPSLNAYLDIQALFGASLREAGSSILPAECLLVIDSGYSHTTVTPLIRGRPVQQAIRRLDVGGKFLTNYLKELVSIRHYNMSDETHLINEVKEAISFVSSDFRKDLERTWKGSSFRQKGDEEDELRVDYILPDYNARREGFVRAHDPSLSAKMRKIGALTGQMEVVEDFMTLGNERFTVPELLFNPGDMGMKQTGLPETVFQSLSGLPPGLWPAMLANILVVGGNAQIRGFMERLESEIRQLAPAECVVRVVKAPDPVKSAWQGGAILGADSTLLKKIQVTRHEYQEYGAAWAARVFSGAVQKD